MSFSNSIVQSETLQFHTCERGRMSGIPENAQQQHDTHYEAQQPQHYQHQNRDDDARLLVTIKGQENPANDLVIDFNVKQRIAK